MNAITDRTTDTPRTDDLAKGLGRETTERALAIAMRHARQLERELAACNDDWNKRYQQWGETEDRLRAEIKALQRFKASVDEALNTGNGTYKP